MKLASALVAVLLMLSGWMLFSEFGSTESSQDIDGVESESVRIPAKTRVRNVTATPGRVLGDSAPTRNAEMYRVPLPAIEKQITANAMDLLPADTSAVLWTDSYQDLLYQLDAYTLLDRYRPRLQSLEDDLVQIGLSIDDFLTIENIGLDASAPVSLAFAGQTDTPTVVFTWRIHDQERLKDVLIPVVESSVGTFVPERLGDAQLLYLEKSKDAAMMLHRDHLFLLVSLGWQTTIDTVAAQIAYQEPGNGLSSTDAWLHAQNELTEASAWGFVNVPAIHASIRYAVSPRADINVANNQDLSESELARLRTQEHQRTLVDSLLGSLQGVIGGIQLDKDIISGELSILTEADSLVQRLLQNRQGISALQRALDTTPGVLFESQLQMAALRELVELIANALGAGDELQRALAFAKTTADLSGDIYDVFDGAFGVSWTRNAQGLGSSEHAVTLALGLNKPQEAERALTILGSFGRLGKLTAHNEVTGGITYNDRHSGSVEIFVEGKTLVFTTQSELIGRFAGGGQRLAHALEAPEAARLLSEPNTAHTSMIHFADLAETDPPAGHYFHMQPSYDDSEPELARLEQRQFEFRKALHRAYEANRQLEYDRNKVVLETLNIAAMSARVDTTAIRMRGSLSHTSGSTPKLVSQLAQYADELHQDQESNRLQIQSLHEDIADIQEQIDGLTQVQ